LTKSFVKRVDYAVVRASSDRRDADAVSLQPVHGDQLTTEERTLLRGAPPAAALRWAAVAAAGEGTEVVGVQALEGGTSSAVHALDLRDHSGRPHAVVLRRFVRADWLAEEPDAVLREAAALRLAADGGLPAPRLLALDARGAAIGDDRPALLMTRLPGRIVWEPADVTPDGRIAPVGEARRDGPAASDRRLPSASASRLDDRAALGRWLDGLAQALAAIHAVPVDDAPAEIGPYDDWGLLIEGPPASSRLPDRTWERAFALFAEPVAAGRRFIHRDFHPGNVLWHDGAVSAVVDWASASLGEPDADVGYCRENLARAHSVAVADRFLARHRALTGDRPLDPAWDVRAALGGHDADDLADWWSAREDAFLAQAVARS
jgi:aminoglycoside phosphotransferase (APT) family kinase protein